MPEYKTYRYIQKVSKDKVTNTLTQATYFWSEVIHSVHAV